MPKKEATKEVLALVEALEARGVHAETEHWDGHKHVDIFVPKLNLYIEVDGMRHDTNAEQIKADLMRDHHSNNGAFYTKRFSNHTVVHHLNAIADAVAEIAHEHV